MKFAKKVIIAVGTEDNLERQFLHMREMNFLAHSEIHFVHVFNTIKYTSLVGDFPLVYPVEADRKLLEESMVILMTKISKEVLPKDFAGRIVVKCLFDERPKNKFCDYVKEVHGDTVIVSKREKHGLFDSSFSQYVMKHCPSNMIVLTSPN